MRNDFDLNLAAAEHVAAGVIDEFGICSPEHIRLRDIACAKGAMVVEEQLSGAAASIVKLGEYATIRIPPAGSPERKRFSIAHELGHLLLNHIESIQKVCSSADMQTWYKGSQETQANFFASELILPAKLVRDRCDVSAVNFEPIRQVAKYFSASLTATAIKFVRLCPEPCAFVYSADKKVKWFYKSPEWRPFIKKNQALDDRTLAYDFFAGEAMEKDPQEIEPEAWVDNVEVEDIESIVEHSISSQKYGFVLSVLWIR